MSARGISARSLRVFLLSGLVVLAGFSQAKADTVTLDFVNVNPSAGVSYTTNGGTNWTGTTAGLFNWNRTAGISYLDATPGTVDTFCIELNQYTGGGVVYTVTAALNTLPLPGGGMGAAKAQQIQTLVNAWKTGALAGSVGFAVVETMMQATIWNLLNESDFSTTSGNFRVSNDGGAAADTTFESNVNSVLGYVSANWSSYNPSTALWFAVGLTSGGNQDQITIVDRPTFIQNLPVPAGVVMAGMGIVCLGGVSFLRRRKVVAAV